MSTDRVERWRGRLSADVQWLSEAAEEGTAKAAFSHVVVDGDACLVDDRPLESAREWTELLEYDELARVRGPFALAARRRDGGVELARDGAGERRIFHLRRDGGLLFASSLRVLLSALAPAERRLHWPAVSAYLSCAFVPFEETLVEGIFELLPGETLRFEPGGSQIHGRFWQLPHAPGNGVEIDEAAATQRLRGALEDAVERRLPASGPVAVSLSGGLDSSLVVALARQLHGGPLHTWSIHFGRRHFNELEFSSAIARHCNTQHHVLELPAAAILAHLDDTVSLLDEPNGDPLTVPNALLFREAATDANVVLNGEGGDPCFGGPKNLPMLLTALQGDSRDASSATLLTRERSYLRSFQKGFDELSAWLTPALWESERKDPVEKRFSARFADPNNPSLVAQLMRINVRAKGVHHILAKVDQLSAGFGAYARSPLFDRDVLEQAMSLPPGLLLRGSVEKYILKRAVADLLPRKIIERPKSGMLVPVESWFQRELRASSRERLLDGLAGWDIIRRDALESLLTKDELRPHPRQGVKLWLLVTLEAWLRLVFRAA